MVICIHFKEMKYVITKLTKQTKQTKQDEAIQGEARKDEVGFKQEAVPWF